MAIYATLFPFNLLRYLSIAFLLFFYLFYDNCSAASASAKGENIDQPLLIRKGNEIFVPEHSALRKRLVVHPVKEEAAPHIITLPGIVEAQPSQIVNILPPLTGRLTELKVNLGDTVKQGQVLAIIHSPDLEQAYADVDKARDTVNFATKSLERAKNVQNLGGSAVKDLEQIQSNYTQALAESKRAENRLKTILDTSSYISNRVLSINAPISGTITSLNSGIGSYINDATASIMTLSNLDNVWVTASVPENLISLISKGQNVDVDLYAYPNEDFHGIITNVSALLEPDTHRNKVRIAFENNDGKLKPNMYASIKIAVPQSSQILVPLSAILMNNDSMSVFIETAPWNFIRREVELGLEDDNNVRILSGLKAGDRIVVRGGSLLND